jgi:hypothetical protein
MANQNAPTHVFGGGVTLTSNTFPSNADPNITYGTFGQPALPIVVTAAGADTVDANIDPYLIIAAGVAGAGAGTHTITFPTPAASLVGRLYTILTAVGAGQTTTVTLSVGSNSVLPATAVIPVNGIGYIYYATATRAVLSTSI